MAYTHILQYKTGAGLEYPSGALQLGDILGASACYTPSTEIQNLPNDSIRGTGVVNAEGCWIASNPGSAAGTVARDIGVILHFDRVVTLNRIVWETSTGSSLRPKNVNLSIWDNEPNTPATWTSVVDTGWNILNQLRDTSFTAAGAQTWRVTFENSDFGTCDLIDFILYHV